MAAVSVSGPVPDLIKVTGPVPVLSAITAPMVKVPAALLTTKSSAAAAPDPAVRLPPPVAWMVEAAEKVLARRIPPEVTTRFEPLRSRMVATATVGAICNELMVLPPVARATVPVVASWRL